MSEASTDASQNMNLKEEVSTETNPIEEYEPETDTENRADKLPEIYPPKVLFFSVLEVGFSTLELPSPSELKLSLITLENTFKNKRHPFSTHYFKLNS